VSILNSLAHFVRSFVHWQTTVQADPRVSQRSHEIDTIVTSISDLATIFHDLNSLVVEQGTVLDRVDYNVEQMSVDVKGALAELGTAHGYQKKGDRRKLICLLLAVITLLVIVLIYKPRGGGSGQAVGSGVGVP